MRVVATFALALLLSGCADSPFTTYRQSEPPPGGSGGPYGGDGTVDLVVAYFSFEIDTDEAFGDMGAHCGFDDWTLDPTTALVHTGGDPDPAHVVMREIHPDQSMDGISHFGASPYALWRDGHAIPRAFGVGDHGNVVFGKDVASFRAVAIPTDRWMLVEMPYTYENKYDDQSDVWYITETLHLRHFPDAPVDYDRRELLCM